MARARTACLGLLPLLPAVAWWLVRFGRVRRSGAHTSTYWSQPRGDDGGLLYVALGDSVAQGIGASRPENGYVGLLAEYLRVATGRPVSVVNLSRSGAKIADVLATQLPAFEALGVNPDLVTVAIGGNDIRGYSAAQFRAEAQRLTASLPPATVIADVPYFGSGAGERNSLEASGILTSGARQHDLIVVSLHEALGRRGWRGMFTDYASDWFHPNDRGHRIWAQAFWTTIGSDLRLSERLSIESVPSSPDRARYLK